MISFRKTSLLLLCLLVIQPTASLTAQNRDSLGYELLVSCWDGNTKRVLRLLSDSADVNYRSDEGITPLMYASQNGKTDIVKILLYNGARADATPVSGTTALMSAAMFGHDSIVDILLEYGANPDLRDINGATALLYAAAYGNETSVSHLLASKADVHIFSNDSITALTASVFNGHSRISALLISAGASVNIHDRYGRSLIHFSVARGFHETTALLLEAGAPGNTGIKGSRHLTPAKIARFNNDKYQLKMLKNAGVRANAAPILSDIVLEYRIASFNSRDIFMGGMAGIRERRWNLELAAGFDSRLIEKRVMINYNENTRLQLWERRNTLKAGLFKAFTLAHMNYPNRLEIITGISALYTYGKYEAMHLKPAPLWIASPSAALSYRSEYAFIKAGYEYHQAGYEGGSPHFFTLSTGFFIGTGLRRKISGGIGWL